jgi:hypothetical protein
MLPLTFLPIYLYSRDSRDGYMIWTHLVAALHSPSAVKTDDMAFIVLAAAFLVLAFAVRAHRGQPADAQPA